MEYSKESLDRIEKIKSLKSSWVICYAQRFKDKQDIIDIKNINKSDYKDSEFLMKQWALGSFRTAGRIIQNRSMGKLIFAKIIDHSSSIQICFMRDNISFNTGKEIVSNLLIDWDIKTAFKIVEKFCQIWDYIGVSWDIFITKHWEITLFVKEFQILSKSVRPLPEKFHGVTDKEIIYRQRYLDLISNEDSLNRFKFRSNFISLLRKFYKERGFYEIETPVLGNSASWTAAKPFTARHNFHDEDCFLRIAPETALKKATVWRFERVFEIWKNFRNEWSDPTHMQEFTSVEHYAAWWNFEDNMKFTEEMFDYIFSKMNLSKQINIKDKNWIERTVDFTTPWKKIDYINGVKQKSWLDILTYSHEDADKLRDDIKNKWYNWVWIDNQWTSTMIDYLYKKVLRPEIIWPAFVYNYPKSMQPLARQSDLNWNIVEQFQLVLNWWEILKSYSELVDPVIQKSNFDEQAIAISKWDEEATASDDDFVLAMEYGMPCQSGWGMGIDRIISILTEQDNLRDVVLFPLMKNKK